MKFKDLVFAPRGHGIPLEQATAEFANGYSASIVRGEFVYGSSDKPYEGAVIGPDGNLAYDTPVTDDVVGYLDEAGVEDFLAQVESLPRQEEEEPDAPLA